MKTWKMPVAVAQKFAANEYVSACYMIKCTTPLNNARFSLITGDNGDGVYNAADDPIVLNPQDYGANYKTIFWCGGYHDVTIVGDLPKNNGFAVVIKDESDRAEPVFYWYGEIIGVEPDESKMHLAHFHVSDLSLDDAIISSNKSWYTT